jgi:hypothetical protein
MNNQLFECSLCGKLTPLIRKTDRLGNGIRHEYAECKQCRGKTTIMYTNGKIRGMLAKQRHTPPGNMKKKLAERINLEIAILKAEME